MAGRKTLRSIRMGRETINGTRVTPRYLWRGTGDWVTDEREIVKVEELVGISGGTNRTYIPKLKASMNLAETEATFEQLPPLFLSLGIGTASGLPYNGSIGAGGSWFYGYNIPSTVFQPTVSFTAESGDNIEAQVAIYCVTEELKLTFAAGESIKVSANMLAQYGTRTNAEGSFSAVGTLEPVTVILASQGSVYLAPDDAVNILDYQVPAGNILGGEVRFKALWSPKYWVDGGIIYPGTMVITGHEISGNLTFEHQRSGTFGGAGSQGQIEKWRNQQAQLMSLRWQPGDGQSFVVTLPIKWDNLQDYDDQDGNNIVTGEFTSKYNENIGNRGQIRFVNQYPSRILGTT